MPTANPRVNVTLSPSLDSLVTALAGYQRVSKSMVLRELLEAAEPALRQAVALMEAAQGASAKARKQIVADLENVVRAAEGVQALALQTAAHHTRDIVSEAQAVRGRRPSATRARAAGAVVEGRGSPGPQNPPPSNRGVKS
jgi:hypothetical protein